jgi:hypothetical protein
MDGHAWFDKCQERLDTDTMDYIFESNEALTDFVIHIRETLHPKAFEELLGSYLDTVKGKEWYNTKLDSMVMDAPENDEDWRLDR